MHIAASEKLGGNPDFGLFTTFKRPLRIHHSVPIICGVEGSLGGIHMCIRVESERKKSQHCFDQIILLCTYVFHQDFLLPDIWLALSGEYVMAV